MDADAASIILEYDYAENGIGAELVTLPEDEEVQHAVYEAWDRRKEEQKKEREALMEQRKNAGNGKRELMEKAKVLDAKLEAASGGKKGKKKKKKKRQWIHVSPNSMEIAAGNQKDAMDS